MVNCVKQLKEMTGKGSQCSEVWTGSRERVMCLLLP